MPRKAYYALQEFFFKINNKQKQQENKQIYGDKLKKAESLYNKLAAWQQEKNWKEFFAHKQDYYEQINKMLFIKESMPAEYKLRYTFLKWRLAKFLNLEEASSLKISLQELAKTPNPNTGFLEALRRVIARLSPEKEKPLRHRLMRYYIQGIKQV